MLQLQRITAELLLSERRSVRASGLLSSLPVFFQGGRQQDAHEAGRYLLTCVDTHWHRLFPATAAAAASGGDASSLSASASSLSASSLSASASAKAMDAKPTRVFEGKMQMRTTCKGCGFYSRCWHALLAAGMLF